MQDFSFLQEIEILDMGFEEAKLASKPETVVWRELPKMPMRLPMYVYKWRLYE